MKVLIAGAGGQLGRALQACAPAGVIVIAPPEADFDITDAAVVARVIADSDADIVFNAAAYTAVDKAEADAALAQRINVDAVALLAAHAAAAACMSRPISSSMAPSAAPMRPMPGPTRSAPMARQSLPANSPPGRMR